MSRMWGTETSLDGQDHETNMTVTCHCTFHGSPLPNFPRLVKWSFLLKAAFFTFVFSFSFIFLPTHFLSLHIILWSSLLFSYASFFSHFYFFISLLTLSIHFFSHFAVLTCPISCCLSTFFLICLAWHMSCAHNTYGTWRIWDQMTWVQQRSSCSIKLYTKAGSQLLLIMSIFNMKGC